MKFMKRLSNAKSWVNGGIHQPFDICVVGDGVSGLVRVNVGVLLCVVEVACLLDFFGMASWKSHLT